MRIPKRNMNRALLELASALVAVLLSGCAQNPKGAASTSPDWQNARSEGFWLDRTPANWNRRTGGPPPPVPAGDAELLQTRCRDQVRPPNSAAEYALVSNGWMLYGPAQFNESTEVITAMSGVDGMCRPLGYQAFVYWQGRYAGTLSPVAMNSRTDGALANIGLASPTRISAEFLRYRESDPLCCPTRITHVTYELMRDDLPLVAPVNINTRLASAAEQGPRTNEVPRNAAASLFGTRWWLIEVNGAAVRTARPYIEFDREVKVFAGDDGCNRIAGGFEINGTNLKFLRPVSMKRACPDNQTQQVETNLLKGLELTTSFQIQGDILLLSAGGTPVLTFKADPNAGPAQ